MFSIFWGAASEDDRDAFTGAEETSATEETSGDEIFIEDSTEGSGIFLIGKIFPAKGILMAAGAAAYKLALTGSAALG